MKSSVWRWHSNFGKDVEHSRNIPGVHSCLELCSFFHEGFYCSFGAEYIWIVSNHIAQGKAIFARFNLFDHISRVNKLLVVISSGKETWCGSRWKAKLTFRSSITRRSSCRTNITRTFPDKIIGAEKGPWCALRGYQMNRNKCSHERSTSPSSQGIPKAENAPCLCYKREHHLSHHLLLHWKWRTWKEEMMMMLLHTGTGRWCEKCGWLGTSPTVLWRMPQSRSGPLHKLPPTKRRTQTSHSFT